MICTDCGNDVRFIQLVAGERPVEFVDGDPAPIHGQEDLTIHRTWCAQCGSFDLRPVDPDGQEALDGVEDSEDAA